MNLFIDTTNWNLVLILEQDGQIIDQVHVANTKKVSDIFIPELEKMLAKNNVGLPTITNFYVLIGPGSYTGIRLGLLFVRTLKTIDNHFQVHVLNSLLFQAGKAKTISVLDAHGGKFFVGIYDKTEPLIKERVVDQIGLENLMKQFQWPVLIDYHELDFAQNFLALKKYFVLVEDYEQLEPMYLKKSV